MATVADLIVEALEARGATGLVSSAGDCECRLGELMLHCISGPLACMPAYAVLCDGTLDICGPCHLPGGTAVCGVPCDWIDEATTGGM